MYAPDRVASRWPAVAIWSLAALFPTMAGRPANAPVWIPRPDDHIRPPRTFLRPSLPVDDNGPRNDIVQPFAWWNGEYKLAETPSSSETAVPPGERPSRSPGTGGGCRPNATLNWDAAVPCFRRTLSAATGRKQCGGQRHLKAIMALVMLAAVFATLVALATFNYCRRRRHSTDPCGGS